MRCALRKLRPFKPVSLLKAGQSRRPQDPPCPCDCVKDSLLGVRFVGFGIYYLFIFCAFLKMVVLQQPSRTMC